MWTVNPPPPGRDGAVATLCLATGGGWYPGLVKKCRCRLEISTTAIASMLMPSTYLRVNRSASCGSMSFSSAEYGRRSAARRSALSRTLTMISSPAQSTSSAIPIGMP